MTRNNAIQQGQIDPPFPGACACCGNYIVQAEIHHLVPRRSKHHEKWKHLKIPLCVSCHKMIDGHQLRDYPIDLIVEFMDMYPYLPYQARLIFMKLISIMFYCEGD